MLQTIRKRLVTLLLILLAVAAVGTSVYMERKAQAVNYQYCNDPCDSYCWT